MRNVNTSVGNALKGGEDLGTSSCGLKSDIEDDLEGSSVLLILGGIVSLLNGSVAGVRGIETDLLEESSGDEETGSISSGIVVETGGDIESSEFVGVSLGEDLISLDGGVDHLSDDSGGGDSDNKSVLGGVVFVLILLNESLSCEVVSLSLTSSEEFGLISHEVSFVLDELDEGHLWSKLNYDITIKQLKYKFKNASHQQHNLLHTLLALFIFRIGGSCIIKSYFHLSAIFYFNFIANVLNLLSVSRLALIVSYLALLNNDGIINVNKNKR